MKHHHILYQAKKIVRANIAVFMVFINSKSYLLNLLAYNYELNEKVIKYFHDKLYKLNKTGLILYNKDCYFLINIFHNFYIDFNFELRGISQRFARKSTKRMFIVCVINFLGILPSFT